MRDRYLMATIAHHKLGDISREKPDLAVIYGEDGDHWIGEWVTGFGFHEVRFPKATTRELTAAERTRFNGCELVVGDRPAGWINLGSDGGEATR